MAVIQVLQHCFFQEDDLIGTGQLDDYGANEDSTDSEESVYSGLEEEDSSDESFEVKRGNKLINAKTIFYKV